MRENFDYCLKHYNPNLSLPQEKKTNSKKLRYKQQGLNKDNWIHSIKTMVYCLTYTMTSN